MRNQIHVRNAWDTISKIRMKDAQMLMLSMYIMKVCLEKIDLVPYRKLPLLERPYLLNLHFTYRYHKQRIGTTWVATSEMIKLAI